MEREVMLTGIGGQGVQLAAQVLARAATAEGHRVSLFGVYGGMMRGGNSDSSLVVADTGAVQAPPLLSRAWAAIVLHHKYWEPMAPKIRDDGLVVVNSSLFEGELEPERYRVVDVPATELATELGEVLTASMVITGSFVGLTGLVGIDTAVQAMRDSLPLYRTQHADRNEAALRRGFEAVERLAVPAWEVAAA